DVDKGKVTGELPELAILDIRLPEISGPEVGARLRLSERLGRIAIVMITAYRLTPEEEEQVKTRAQADMLMYKPLPSMPALPRTPAQCPQVSPNGSSRGQQARHTAEYAARKQAVSRAVRL